MKKKLLILLTAICSINCFAQLPTWLPTNGLVAWYPFNGNANDESGNGNNGTVFGAALITDRFGNLSSAYNFDGTTYIKGSSSNFPAQDRTISIWYKIDDLANYNTLMGYGGGVCGTSFFAILHPRDIEDFHTSSHCNVNSVFTNNGYSENNNWNNWVITANGNATTYYLNGIKIYDTIASYYGTYVIGKDFAFGSMSAPWGVAPYADENVSYLKGSLDDIVIYNRVLDSTEIQQLDCACIPQPSVSIPDRSTPEGNSSTKLLKFPVTLSNAYSDTVRVKYKTFNNTATAGSDYAAKQGMLTFLPGQTTKNISITINGDTQVELNESFYVLLGFPENATIAEDTAVGVIRNDDGASIAAENDDNAKTSSSPVTLSPNPAKNQITVSNALPGAIITISNINGQKILQQKINANVQSIDISKLLPGIYLFDYMNGNKKQQLKFVKE